MERRAETKALRCSLEKSKRAGDASLPPAPRKSLLRRQAQPKRNNCQGDAIQQSAPSHLPHAGILLSFWPGGLLKPLRDPLQARDPGKPPRDPGIQLVWRRAAFAPARPAAEREAGETDSAWEGRGWGGGRGPSLPLVTRLHAIHFLQEKHPLLGLSCLSRTQREGLCPLWTSHNTASEMSLRGSAVTAASQNSELYGVPRERRRGCN